LYFLHFPTLRVVDSDDLVYATDDDMMVYGTTVYGTMVYADYSSDDDGDGGDDSDYDSNHNSMDNPNRNTNSSSICMANSNNSMENPSHNTNYTKVLPPHPKCQTSRSHT
jgi:hypothetical protein